MFYPKVNDEFSDPRPRIIFEHQYNFLSDISNFAIFKSANVSFNILNGLKNIDEENYRWGTEIIDFVSTKDFTTIYYMKELPGDTEFPEKIPTEWFIKLLEDWVNFLEFVEKDKAQ